MIFDLKSGKRRRVVQVVFGFLAFIFVISFVGFGIGSDAAGGIFDALGFGSGSSNGDTQYEEQIEDAEETLETDSENERALRDLVNYYFLAATQEGGIEQDPQTGQTSISEESRSQLEQTVSAWEDYLAIDPQRPDAATAASAAQAYVFLADFGGAAEAQEIVADINGTAADYGQLALYHYQDLQIEAGDAAGDKAVEAADASQRQQIRKQMDSLADAARKFKRQLEQQAEQGGGEAGEGQLENPFGGLGGGSTVPPTTPAP